MDALNAMHTSRGDDVVVEPRRISIATASAYERRIAALQAEVAELQRRARAPSPWAQVVRALAAVFGLDEGGDVVSAVLALRAERDELLADNMLLTTMIRERQAVA